MYFMPEKIYRKLSEQDAANEEKFYDLDGLVDEAYEDMLGDLPEEYEELMDTLDGLEDSYVISVGKSGDELELKFEGFDEDGEEAVFILRFDEVWRHGVRLRAPVQRDICGGRKTGDPHAVR